MLNTKPVMESPVGNSELPTKKRPVISLRSRQKSGDDISEVVDRLLSHFQQNLNWFRRKPWIPHHNSEIQAQLYFMELNFNNQAMQLKNLLELNPKQKLHYFKSFLTNMKKHTYH